MVLCSSFFFFYLSGVPLGSVMQMGLDVLGCQADIIIRDTKSFFKGDCATL